MKPGESISIPCLYESKYEKHVKYLCKGFYWATCSDVVKTNKPDTSGKFSVQDDKEQKTFTLNINHVESTDSDYWCVVEIDGGADVGEYFRLSVSGEYLFSPVFFFQLQVLNVSVLVEMSCISCNISSKSHRVTFFIGNIWFSNRYTCFKCG